MGGWLPWIPGRPHWERRRVLHLVRYPLSGCGLKSPQTEQGTKALNTELSDFKPQNLEPEVELTFLNPEISYPGEGRIPHGVATAQVP